jgi:hypothetical protein
MLSESSVIKLPKPENLVIFRGQKRWIFLPEIGSPGKVGNNGIQEVVGSAPISKWSMGK